MMTLVSLLTSCAPKPGNDLLEGLLHPTAIEDIKITITTDSEEVSQKCNALFLEENQYGMVVANCLLNFCIWVGCANVQWDDQGDIYSCDVYAISEWGINHEMRHCLGYADVLY